MSLNLIKAPFGVLFFLNIYRHNLILQLQTLLDQIEHEELGIVDVKEKLQDIVDDAHNLYDVDDYMEEESNF